MSAILSVIMGVCRKGDRIVASQNLFGATVQLLNNFIAKFGVDVCYVPTANPRAWKKAAQGGAKLLLVETPSNPLIEVFDIAALSKIAHDAGAILAVDNCFCPSLQKPLSLGADLVIHSGTKYLDGQGRALGGGVAGKKDFLMEAIYPFLRSGGPSLSPFNAWVLAKGLETLSLRIHAHSARALKIARWLEKQRKVRRVLYTGLNSHPAHSLAMRQQQGGGGGVLFPFLRRGEKKRHGDLLMRPACFPSRLISAMRNPRLRIRPARLIRGCRKRCEGKSDSATTFCEFPSAWKASATFATT